MTPGQGRINIKHCVLLHYDVYMTRPQATSQKAYIFLSEYHHLGLGKPNKRVDKANTILRVLKITPCLVTLKPLRMYQLQLQPHYAAAPQQKYLPCNRCL